jgi:hypothetical protein
MTTSTDTSCIEILKEAWVPFKANLPTLLAASFVMIYLPMIVVGVPASIAGLAVGIGDAVKSRQAPSFLSMLPIIVIAAPAFAVLYNLFRVGWTKMLLDVTSGQRIKFSDLMSGKPWFVNFLITVVLISIASMIGTCFLVVPGVLVVCFTCFAPFLVITENLGPVEAIQRSQQMVMGYFWQVLLYYVLMFVANSVLGLIPFVGGFMSFAVVAYFDLALCMMYKMRSGDNFMELEQQPQR